MSLTPGGASPKSEKRVKNKELRKFIDTYPCAICGEPGTNSNPITHHHLKRWGAGGIDERNMIPVHWFKCHQFAHTYAYKDTDRLSLKAKRDLRAYAIQLTEEFNSL